MEQDMNARKWVFGAVAVLSVGVVSGPAMAQVCLGVPLSAGQTSLGLNFDMPDGANIIGAAVNHHLSPLTVGAHYAMTSYDSEVADFDSDNTVGAQVAFDLPVGAESGFGICPVAGVQGTFGNDRTVIQVPVGAGLGAAFEVDSGIWVAPFVVPQFVWSRFDASGEGDAVTDSDFEISGGANLVVSNLFFGARVARPLVDNAETTFGVQAGIVF
jgi:hypothetical protein